MLVNGFAKEHSSVLAVVLRIIDWLVILLSGYMSFKLLEHVRTLPSYEVLIPKSYLWLIIVSVLLAALIFPRFNVYRAWRGESIFREVKAILTAWVCVFVVLLVFLVFTKSTEEYSRAWMLCWFASASFSLLLARAILRYGLRRYRAKGFNQRHIIIVGSGELGQKVALKLLNSAWTGFNISGFFTDTETKYIYSGVSTLKDLGTMNDVVRYVEMHSVDQVWITVSLRHSGKVNKLVNELQTVAVDVRLVPDIYGFDLLNHSISHVDGMPIIDLSVTPMVGINKLVKWFEDKVLALFILIIISPMMLVTALGVKLSSPGPVFYRQERVSWNGKRFNMLKFRSMPVDTDSRTGGPVWGGAKDKQPTKFGAFIRRTSLDELPQFINVLKGDMSIVGPRPERTVFVDQFKHEIPSYMKKHLVKAGITGWAQINGWRGDTCLNKRVEYDLQYIENWSIWFDVKIILLTFFKGLINKNAY